MILLFLKCLKIERNGSSSSSRFHAIDINVHDTLNYESENFLSQYQQAMENTNWDLSSWLATKEII